jgi:hypothetical protein
MFGEFAVNPALQARLLKLGYAADPATEILLDKRLIAQIKIRQLEMVVQTLESQLELVNMEREMLMKEYG